MNLYDSISQSDLNSVIDLLLGNYHKELNLSLDDPGNGYCGLSFECTGLDAGDEFILNSDDVLRVFFSDARLANLGYSLRLYFYQLDKGDIDGSKGYGDLQSVLVDLDDDVVVVPFSVDQVYLQKGFDLVLMGNSGSRLFLSAPESIFLGEDCVLTAEYVSGGEPVESATVTFYEGETVLGTSTTDEDGVATLTVDALSVGRHGFTCTSNGVYSANVTVSVIYTGSIIELGVTGDSFSTYSSSPFVWNGRVFVDWGDDTSLIEYSGGPLSHTYDSSDEYTVKVYGDITSLGANCFNGCTGLTNITIPDSVTSLGGGCFVGCTGLTNITIPDSVTSLGIHCFDGCSGLTSINIPSGVTSLGTSCFNGCSGLTSINIPSGVTSLGKYCFSYCTGLTSINLPSSVTSLGGGCFVGCTGLTNINIPIGVTSLGNYCFYNCTGLTSIILQWNTPPQNYNSSWINYSPAIFSIPHNTTTNYTNKQYPQDKINERGQ